MRRFVSSLYCGLAYAGMQVERKRAAIMIIPVSFFMRITSEMVCFSVSIDSSIVMDKLSYRTDTDHQNHQTGYYSQLNLPSLLLRCMQTTLLPIY